MSAQGILLDAAISQGWDETTQLALALDYIDNQQDNNGFREYLQYVCEEEEKLTRP